MSASSAPVSIPVNRLKIPAPIQRGISDFVTEVVALYGDDLISIIAFGSAVTGDYDPGESDVNLLVVHRSLDIEDLDKVGALSRRWLRRQMLAPRFLSQRNFDDYVSHFQVDLLAMRDATVVLWGRDLLSDVPMRRVELRWQAAYEIKAMRMRIKQQFWRVADNPRAMRAVLVQRFTSLTHVMRAALALRDLPAPPGRADVIAAAVTHFGVDAALGAAVEHLRDSRATPPRAALVTQFGALMEAIRLTDAAIEQSSS